MANYWFRRPAGTVQGFFRATVAPPSLDASLALAMSHSAARGNTELLECVLLARQVQDGSLDMRQGCSEIARRVISGQVNPNDACRLLAEVSESLKSPKELSAFEVLAHEQYGHERLGFTAELCAAEIVKECHRLVSRGDGQHGIGFI